VERRALQVIDLSTRQAFAGWRRAALILRGWARSASGETAEGVAWIENGIRDIRSTRSTLNMPYYLALKAEALHLADRIPEAFEAVSEAQAIIEQSEDRSWSADLSRLRGVFLTAMGADEAQIDASFCAAISTAREQKSISLAKRAEETYAEYRRQKPRTSEGHGFQLPLR
jgi:predicted ATPase